MRIQSSELSNEERLALRLRHGESDAMRDFYAQYSRMITAICARYISDDDDMRDAVQDTLVTIFSQIGKFSYRGAGSLKAWTARLTVNTSINALRKKSRLNTIPIDDHKIDMADAECSTSTTDIPPNVLHDMIRQLPDGYRAVFNLYAIDHRSHKEIAQALGIKEASSASQYLRAKKLLANKINHYIKANDKRL